MTNEQIFLIIGLVLFFGGLVLAVVSQKIRVRGVRKNRKMKVRRGAGNYTKSSLREINREN